METVWPVIYRIDAGDRMNYINDGWNAFADGNEGGALHPDNVIGRSLWEFVADQTTRQLYRDMVNRVHQDGSPIRFHFRCDAPRLKRLLAMIIERLDTNSIQFTVTASRVVPSSMLPSPSDATTEPSSLLSICGWCKQVRVASDIWRETEGAIEEMSLFERAGQPSLTHGICPDCYDTLMAMLDDPAVGATGSVTLGELRTE